MIITLTMHPCIDKSTTIDKMLPEKKLRCTQVIDEPGGGGINVAKALRKLGADPLAIFPAGGHNGNMLRQLVEAEKVRYKHIQVDIETRESFIVLETASNKQYRFGTPGGNLAHSNAEACLELIRNEGAGADYIVASGSLAPGLSDSFYAEVARLSKSLGAKFVLDTSGPPLQLALDEDIFLLKPNISELSKLLGVDRIEDDDVDEAAREVIRKGKCKVIVVSLGSRGAVLVTRDFHKLVPPPDVEKKSTVGAGDSMVAGMVWMLSQDKSLEEVIDFGVACGTAATMNEGTELFQREDVFKLYEGIRGE